MPENSQPSLLVPLDVELSELDVESSFVSPEVESLSLLLVAALVDVAPPSDVRSLTFDASSLDDVSSGVELPSVEPVATLDAADVRSCEVAEFVAEESRVVVPDDDDPCDNAALVDAAVLPLFAEELPVVAPVVTTLDAPASAPPVFASVPQAQNKYRDSAARTGLVVIMALPQLVARSAVAV